MMVSNIINNHYDLNFQETDCINNLSYIGDNSKQYILIKILKYDSEIIVN